MRFLPALIVTALVATLGACQKKPPPVPAPPAILPYEIGDAYLYLLGRALVLREEVTPTDAAAAVDAWRQLGVERVAATGLLGRVWELRPNLTAYDATYVALAEALQVPLVTADGRLARSPGPRCTVTVLRT